MSSKIPFVVLIICVLVVVAGISYRFMPADVGNRIDPLTNSGEFDQNDTVAAFNGEKISFPQELLAFHPSQPNLDSRVLGDQYFEKHIEVDLTTQTLTLFEGGAAVNTFLVSTGKWGKTPTGTFTIWGKFRYAKMEGGSKERHTYYYLPNVPYVLFFSNNEVAASKGFSIHGAYWHNNFGVPMSHGCVNMDPKEAKIVYDWANPVLPEGKNTTLSSEENVGTQVIIYGEAPQSL